MNDIPAPPELLERISSYTEVEDGSDDVYEVMIDGSKFIVKLRSQNNKDAFRSEPIIQEWVHPKVSFHIPKVEEYNFTGETDYIMLEYIEGMEPERIELEGLTKTISQMSQILRELGTVETPFETAGALTATENEEIETTSTSSWRPYILLSIDNLEPVVPDGFTSYVEDIIAFADSNKQIIPRNKTQVIHGDFRFENILVSNDGSVNTVLDWGRTYSGDIWYNYVRTAYFMRRDLNRADYNVNMATGLFQNAPDRNLELANIYQLHVMAVEMKNMSWWYSDKQIRQERTQWIESQVEKIVNGENGFVADLISQQEGWEWGDYNTS